jgi:hypothetical protein
VSCAGRVHACEPVLRLECPGTGGRSELRKVLTMLAVRLRSDGVPQRLARRARRRDDGSGDRGAIRHCCCDVTRRRRRSGLEDGRGLDRCLRHIGDLLRGRLGGLRLARLRLRRRSRRWRGVHRRWWNQLNRGRWRRARWRWRWGGNGARRQQRERIHIALRIARHADTQMDVRNLVLGRSARSDRPDRRPFANRVTFLDGERAKLNERDRVAVVGLDRDDLSVRAYRPGECDGPGSRCEYGSAAIPADVDSAMLAARVRVAAEDERLEHVARSRPRPAVGGGGQRKHCKHDCDYCKTAHRCLLVSDIDNGSP